MQLTAKFDTLQEDVSGIKLNPSVASIRRKRSLAATTRTSTGQAVAQNHVLEAEHQSVLGEEHTNPGVECQLHHHHMVPEAGHPFVLPCHNPGYHDSQSGSPGNGNKPLSHDPWSGASQRHSWSRSPTPCPRSSYPHFRSRTSGCHPRWEH